MHPVSELPISPGQIFAGKYRVERVIGAGGMGMVVAATHVDLGELRAVKFMLPSSVGDTVALERFFREARAASKLKSDHVARVHDVGRTEQAAPYIVMEYLEGQDLAALLKRGPLPIDRAVDYIIQACDAVAEAHAAGIVHRDLKPANLFLTRGADGSPCVKVLDFGISKVGDAGAPSQLTDTDATIGSPFHMSPEQMRASRKVDQRTDIWSLGVVLYQLVTGELPFQGEGRYAVCFAIAEDAPMPPRARRADVPPGLEAAILRCLEKSPDARFPDVAALCEAIAPFSPVQETAVRLRRIQRLGAGRVDVTATGSEPQRLSQPEAARSQGDGATQSSWGGAPKARPARGRPVSAVVLATTITLAGAVVLARLFVWPAHAPASASEPVATAEPVAASPRPVESAPEIAPAPAPTAAASSAPRVAADEGETPAVDPSASSVAGKSSASASASPPVAPAHPAVRAPIRAPVAAPPPVAPPAAPNSDPWGRTRKL